MIMIYDWFLTMRFCFDVDRHERSKCLFIWNMYCILFGRCSFSCFSSCCFFVVFFVYPLIFIFVSYLFWLFWGFFHSLSVLIRRNFHYLYLYLFSCSFRPVQGFFLCLFWWYWAFSNELVDQWKMWETLGSAIKIVKQLKKHCIQISPLVFFFVRKEAF